jgi:hypothetical protein
MLYSTLASRAGLSALGVSRSLLVRTALSGDIGIGLWESSRPHFHTDNLIYDGSEFGRESQADLRIRKMGETKGWGWGRAKCIKRSSSYFNTRYPFVLVQVKFVLVQVKLVLNSLKFVLVQVKFVLNSLKFVLVQVKFVLVPLKRVTPSGKVRNSLAFFEPKTILAS